MADRPPFLCANTIDELIACAALPLHAYPTVEFAVRNVELPLDQDDYDWVTANEINLFGVDTLQSRSKVSRGSNTTGPTFTVDTPTMVTGICVFAYGEPYSTVVEGNQFGPRSVIGAQATTPASPINLRSDVAAALFSDGVFPAGVTAANICPSQLDWGGPTWRFIWAFLNAFRLRFDCPNSAYDTIINERLVDIGNCCSLIDFSGLSDANTPHTFITRRMNTRLAGITLPATVTTYDNAPAVTEPGYFVPFSCEQDADGHIEPNRMVAQDAAYGRPAALPAIESWYRLPFPMPLDTNTKIKLILDKSAGDEDYEQRMLDEGVMRSCVGPIPGVAGTFRLNEDGHTPGNTGYAQFTNIPGGMMRLGLGLKGFQVREGVCHQWKRTLANKALMTALLNKEYKAFDGTGMCGGTFGAPGTDLGEKVIDAVLSGGGIEQVQVGPVGE